MRNENKRILKLVFPEAELPEKIINKQPELYALLAKLQKDAGEDRRAELKKHGLTQNFKKMLDNKKYWPEIEHNEPKQTKVEHSSTLDLGEIEKKLAASMNKQMQEMFEKVNMVIGALTYKGEKPAVAIDDEGIPVLEPSNRLNMVENALEKEYRLAENADIKKSKLNFATNRSNPRRLGRERDTEKTVNEVIYKTNQEYQADRKAILDDIDAERKKIKEEAEKAGVAPVANKALRDLRDKLDNVLTYNVKKRKILNPGKVMYNKLHIGIRDHMSSEK